METAGDRGYIVPYRNFVMVWLVLICLTALLVLAGTVFHRTLSVAAMLTLTPLKAGLVFYYFMHLKYEKPFLKFAVFVALTLLTVTIAMIFLDISYR
jgi:cytochrome c oxidase subunit IV